MEKIRNFDIGYFLKYQVFIFTYILTFSNGLIGLLRYHSVVFASNKLIFMTIVTLFCAFYAWYCFTILVYGNPGFLPK